MKTFLPKSLFLAGLALVLSFSSQAATFTSYGGYYQASYPSTCTPAVTTFSQLVAYPGAFSKKIDFGDGTILTTWGAGTINHTYSIADEYDITVYYYNSLGFQIGYDQLRIEVYGQPGNVENVYGATSACPFDKVRMTVSQGWNPSPDFSYSWDWGDGSPLEVSNYNDLQHVYTSTGTYTITVTTTGGPCGATYTSTGNFTITNTVALPPYVSYNVWLNPKTVCPNQEVYFAYPNEFASTFVQWGDGTSSTTGEHRHSYTSLGTYYPQVTITNGCGFSQTFKDTVKVVNYLHWSPSSYFDINYNNTVCPGTTVNFSSWFGATSLAWYSQDGTLLSNESYFEHEFTTSDSVYVIATNGCGFDTTLYAPVQVTSSIPVNPSQFNPFVTDSVCIGSMFSYMSDNNDSNNDMNYSWDFGDGTPVVTDYSGEHAYATGGTYTITVTATNSCGQDTLTTFPIFVGAGIGPDPSTINYFVPEDAEVCPGDSALFVGLSFLSDGTYSLDFGDGNVSTTPTELNIFGFRYFYFTHAYSTLGTYNTTLTFTNGCGISLVKSLTVTVGSNVEADANAFYDEANNICLGDPINFYGFGGNQYVWDFGDGSGTLITNSVMDPVPHVYENAGSYTVNVQITNGCGNSTTSDILIIVPDNKINITTNTIDATCHQADGKAIAVITGGNSPYEVIWSNGSNDILVDSLTSGIYVCNVTDQNGCYNFGIATVSDAEAPAILVNTVSDVTCNGGHNGVIDINVIGSSAPYTYNWSNGSTSQDQAGLVAGPYEIYVTDANGCVATESIVVDQPDEVLVSFIVTKADCGLDNGSIAATANGTSGPFTYVWNTGDVGPNLTNVGLGLYELNVIDSKGCIVTKLTSVDEDNGEGGPAVSLNTISDLDCGGIGSTIDISIFASAGTPTFLWSTGATTEDITVTAVGDYVVTVTDPLTGCQSIESFTIEHADPVQLNVCMVSVDSMYAANRVIFEKPVSTTISYFKIYRESSMAGLYYHVGNVHYDSLSVFTDLVANPQIQSWRYKISVVDNCGAESELSGQHKTMHLNQNLGLVPGSVNLIWDDYEGFSYSTVNVVRYTSSAGYVTLASLSSSLHSYTDLAAPLSDPSLFYIITIDLSTAPCVATRAQNNNTVRSNRTDNALMAPGTPDAINENVAHIAYSHVYPNPTSNNITVEFEVSQSADYTIQVIDAIGNVLHNENCGRVDLFYKKDINLDQIERGVYFINIQSKDGRISKRLIKM